MTAKQKRKEHNDEWKNQMNEDIIWMNNTNNNEHQKMNIKKNKHTHEWTTHMNGQHNMNETLMNEHNNMTQYINTQY